MIDENFMLEGENDISLEEDHNDDDFDHYLTQTLYSRVYEEFNHEDYYNDIVLSIKNIIQHVTYRDLITQAIPNNHYFYNQIFSTNNDDDNLYAGFDNKGGMNKESINYNIKFIPKVQSMINQNELINYIYHNKQYLSILGMEIEHSGSHAVVFMNNANSILIIDPLNEKLTFSNLEKLTNNLLSLGIKFINIIYSGLQQPNSGVCADISLILVKNLADKLQDIQSVQDIVRIIQDVRIEMYGKTLEKNQETIIVKSFDVVTSKTAGLTQLKNCEVGIPNEEKQQNNYYDNNEFIATLQQDGIFIKPIELIGDVILL